MNDSFYDIQVKFVQFIELFSFIGPSFCFTVLLNVDKEEPVASAVCLNKGGRLSEGLYALKYVKYIIDYNLFV